MRDVISKYAVAILAAATVCLACSNDDTVSPGSAGDPTPRLAVQPDTTIAYGDTLRLNASASDPNGGPLTFSMAVLASLTEVRTGYRAQARMDPSSGAFWFYPGPRDVPSRSFQFTVTDDIGLTDTTRFKVTVVTR